jgi:predicted unusual protein kinase regulating ubiquinone biosynthesis (AarF/ABC1/UbiB family)
MFEFIFTTLFKHKLFYSDIHYGNFLVKDKNILYVMDFGCISEFNDELLHNLKLLYKSLYDGDDDLFYAIAEDLNILTDKITSDEDIKFLLDRFKIMLQPLLHKGIFDFSDVEWNKEFGKYSNKTEDWGLLSELVLFAKIPFGLFPIFVNMKVNNINFSEILLKIIEEN